MFPIVFLHICTSHTNKLLADEFLMNLIRKKYSMTIKSDEVNCFISFLFIAINFSMKQEN